MENYQPLGYLPNKEGFEFTGITKDGDRLNCVVKLVDGMHMAYSNNKPCFKQLRSWINKQNRNHCGSVVIKQEK